jgi:hypothetical protein
VLIWLNTGNYEDLTMKLQELGAKPQTARIAKVFESHLGNQIDFGRLTPPQAQKMLRKVQVLIREHRTAPSFYYSHRNPDYIKLVMLEQALTTRMREEMPATSAGSVTSSPATPASSITAGTRKAAAATGSQAGALGKAMQSAAAGKALDPVQRKAMAGLAGGLGKAMSDPAQATRLQQMLQKSVAAESKRRKLKESEIQQAQVVMAAQDMVDQLQKMLEQVSAMEFKDLPALANAIKNDTGVEQATQFQADVTAALTTLLTAIQTGKQQLETAQGILTGQPALTVPGTEGGEGEPPAAPVGEPGADIGADLGLDANLPTEEEPELEPKVALGRERR